MGQTIRMARRARCGATFVKIRSSVCEKCMDDEEGDYRRISDVLAGNTDLNVEGVAEAATTKCVLRMLDRGLIANDQVTDDVRCGRCGELAISASKRLCHTCLIKLGQNFFLRSMRRSLFAMSVSYNRVSTTG